MPAEIRLEDDGDTVYESRGNDSGEALAPYEVCPGTTRCLALDAYRGFIMPSVITSDPATRDHFKTGQGNRTQLMGIRYSQRSSTMRHSFSMAADAGFTALEPIINTLM